MYLKQINLMEIFVFQAKVGQQKEFQVALRRLRGKDADITREAAEIQVWKPQISSI